MPGDRLPPPPRADRRPSSTRRSPRAGVTLDEIELVAGDPRARTGRRAARRVQRRQGARRGARAAVRAGRPPARPPRGELPRARTPFEPPFLCLIASGGHTLLADVRDRGPSACGARRRRSTTPPARRSTRARGCSGSATPAAPALERLARDGDPEAFEFPTGARMRGLDFSFAGPEDGAAVPDPRPRRGRGRAPPRGSGRVLPARDRRGAARSASSAALARDGCERLARRRRRGGERAAARRGWPSSASSSTSRRRRCAPTTRR